MSQNTVRLPLLRKIGLGAGEIGFNFYWTSTSVFLLFFYTDVLRIPVVTAGLIYMLALSWDAIIDPVVGLLADRTRTRRLSSDGAVAHRISHGFLQNRTQPGAGSRAAATSLTGWSAMSIFSRTSKPTVIATTMPSTRP